MVETALPTHPEPDSTLPDALREVGLEAGIGVVAGCARRRELPFRAGRIGQQRRLVKEETAQRDLLSRDRVARIRRDGGEIVALWKDEIPQPLAARGLHEAGAEVVVEGVGRGLAGEDLTAGEQERQHQGERPGNAENARTQGPGLPARMSERIDG